ERDEEYPHHRRELVGAAADRPELRELSPRAPPADDGAALQPATHASHAAYARCPRRRLRDARLPLRAGRRRLARRLSGPGSAFPAPPARRACLTRAAPPAG